MEGTNGDGAFVIKDCAFTALATGREARNLKELAAAVGEVSGGSLYYHFWGRLLRPVFRQREYVNDFGDWAAYQLRDRVLAERLALVDPADFKGPEALRARLVELVGRRLEEIGAGAEAPPGEEFRFVEGKIVVFDTGRRVREPRELARVVPELSRSSVYYHMIDARYRSPTGDDDFQRWLRDQGEDYASLASALAFVDFYSTSMAQLQEELIRLFQGFFGEEEG